MRSRRHWRRPPSWWPANEPWPPPNRVEVWRRGRGRFLRRMVILFAAMFFLSALGLSMLISLVRGRGASPYLSTGALIVAVGFCVLILLFGAIRRFGVPLGDIVEGANRVATGDFSARVPAHGPPSLRTVANAFNSMAERLESQERQRRHFMADVAHELRTPIAVVQGRLEGLLDGVYPRDDSALTELLDETRILARLLEDLRSLANAESGALALTKEPTDIVMLMSDVTNSFSRDAELANVSIKIDVPTDLPLISVDPTRIREVLSNLISNALHHTPANGVIMIQAKVSNDCLILSVADTGSGIPAEDLPKIFQRFYKGAGSRGSGLGLTIARNLVLLHGGEIRAESREGHGSAFTVILPVA